jgi:hypothetical protein
MECNARESHWTQVKKHTRAWRTGESAITLRNSCMHAYAVTQNPLSAQCESLLTLKDKRAMPHEQLTGKHAQGQLRGLILLGRIDSGASATGRVIRRRGT